MSVCWEQRSRPILASIDTSPSSAPPASTGFGSCVVAGVHSTHSQQRHLYIHSCLHASTSCNALLAGATDKLQRVMNAAARVITGTHKFDRGLSPLLHTELHWLNVPERVTYKLCIMVHSCLQGQAPQYLVDFCLPVSDVASRQHLRSAIQLTTPGTSA